MSTDLWGRGVLRGACAPQEESPPPPPPLSRPAPDRGGHQETVSHRAWAPSLEPRDLGSSSDSEVSSPCDRSREPRLLNSTLFGALGDWKARAPPLQVASQAGQFGKSKCGSLNLQGSWGPRGSGLLGLVSSALSAHAPVSAHDPGPGGSGWLCQVGPLSSAPTPKQGEVAGLSRVSPSPHLGHRAARAVTRLQPPEWLEILPSTSPRSCWFFGHKAEQLKAQTPGLPRGCRLHSRTMLCAPGQIPDRSWWAKKLPTSWVYLQPR